jgi:hypothetical protein
MVKTVAHGVHDIHGDVYRSIEPSAQYPFEKAVDFSCTRYAL